MKSSILILSNTSGLKSLADLTLRKQKRYSKALNTRTVIANKERGAFFEGVFKKRAQSNGFYCEKHELSCKYIGGGRLLRVKGELDYKLITQTGQVGYFDCKSYLGDSFSFSVIDENQLKKSTNYNYYSVPSGFVVWFRLTNQVVFIKGRTIAEKGPSCSFRAEDGLVLGSIESFDLKAIMRQA